jgi:hypothetical protein
MEGGTLKQYKEEALKQGMKEDYAERSYYRYKKLLKFIKPLLVS